ncbi:MAG: hypothetical protein ACRDSK_05905 [Actinophytocola sp.]|uniref:hypothetical protein n=1 Tax=Actinophytocola sp. TaxID=1872138 RepID=UPI003D6C5150
MLVVHWLLMLGTGSVFLAGYLRRWPTTPTAMATSYATLATMCAIETFGYLTNESRFVDMSLEYLTYAILLTALYRTHSGPIPPSRGAPAVTGLRIAVFGATGAAGSDSVRHALPDPRVAKIRTAARRALTTTAKLARPEPVGGCGARRAAMATLADLLGDESGDGMPSLRGGPQAAGGRAARRPGADRAGAAPRVDGCPGARVDRRRIRPFGTIEVDDVRQSGGIMVPSRG